MLLLGLGERGLATLQAEALDPPQRTALAPLGLGLVNRQADGERLAQVDARELRGGVPNQGEVAQS
jgi:hypothetical protein